MLEVADNFYNKGTTAYLFHEDALVFDLRYGFWWHAMLNLQLQVIFVQLQC